MTKLDVKEKKQITKWSEMTEILVFTYHFYAYTLRGETIRFDLVHLSVHTYIQILLRGNVNSR